MVIWGRIVCKGTETIKRKLHRKKVTSPKYSFPEPPKEEEMKKKLEMYPKDMNAPAWKTNANC